MYHLRGFDFSQAFLFRYAINSDMIIRTNSGHIRKGSSHGKHYEINVMIHNGEYLLVDIGELY